MIPAIRVICFTMLLSAFSFRAAAEDFTNAIHAFLQQRVEVEKRDVGMVVGIVDEHGSSIVSYGKLDNGTDQEVNGDTLFEIGSITKTFTALLLQDMIERGEMKLDDPVAKYLPKSVKMPTRNGKEITLLQLATQTSGLPLFPDNLDPKRADNPYADYTVEKLYAFLSGYQLTRDPGAKYEYSERGNGIAGPCHRPESRDELRIAGGGSDLPAIEDGQHADHADARTEIPARHRTQSTRIRGIESGISKPWWAVARCARRPMTC